MKVTRSDKLMQRSKNILAFIKVKGQMKVKRSYLLVQSSKGNIDTKFKGHTCTYISQEIRHDHMKVKRSWSHMKVKLTHMRIKRSDTLMQRSKIIVCCTKGKGQAHMKVKKSYLLVRHSRGHTHSYQGQTYSYRGQEVILAYMKVKLTLMNVKRSEAHTNDEVKVQTCSHMEFRQVYKKVKV